MSSTSPEVRAVASAPGKMILFGEHAVVYGHYAIAVAVKQRSFVELELGASRDGAVSLVFSDLAINLTWPAQSVAAAVRHEIQLLQEEGKEEEQGMPVFSHQRLERLLASGLLAADSHVSVLAFVYALVSLYAEQPHEAELLALSASGLSCSMTSQLPIGAGLGSSAAFAVSLCLALLLFRQRHRAALACAPLAPCQLADLCFESCSPRERALVNQWAFVVETLIHGTPSGIDNTCSTYGGAVRYARGQEVEVIPGIPPLRFLITDTKIPKSTKALVAGVRERMTHEPEVYGPVVEAIADISLSCHKLFSSNAELTESLTGTLEGLIDANQRHLHTIGVSHEAIESVVRIAKGFGLHAKLTGAGGGGCVITMLPPSVSEVTLRGFIQALDAASLGASFETEIGCPGASSHPGKLCDVLPAR